MYWLSLGNLPLHVITAPSLRLDVEADRQELDETLTHHMAKRSRGDPGQALRGSSDLHAWTDSAC
ncbi:MAG: hypothetical protein ACI9W4_002333 [Rhodothermales bacterium]|jgi:hypothetical protein